MKRAIKEQSGMTLIESIIAILILLGGLLTMAQALVFTVALSKTYGNDSGKATAAARDKMEELSNLDFSDVTTNVTIASPYDANGSGLKAGGSIYPSSPADAKYVDYTDSTGARTGQNSASFRRQWQIEDEVDATGAVNSKKIMVSVISMKKLSTGIAPSTTLVTLKSR